MSLLGGLLGPLYPQNGGTTQPPAAPAPTAPTGQGAVAPAASGGESGGASSTGSGPSGGTAAPVAASGGDAPPAASPGAAPAPQPGTPIDQSPVIADFSVQAAPALASGPTAAVPVQTPAAAAPAAAAPEPADDEESARSAAIAAQAREHLASLAGQIRKPDDTQYADHLKALRNPGEAKRKTLDRAA